MTPLVTCHRQARLTPLDPVGRLLNLHQIADDPVYSGRPDIRNLVKKWKSADSYSDVILVKNRVSDRGIAV
jgi:hypothetical protein